MGPAHISPSPGPEECRHEIILQYLTVGLLAPRSPFPLVSLAGSQQPPGRNPKVNPNHRHPPRRVIRPVSAPVIHHSRLIILFARRGNINCGTRCIALNAAAARAETRSDDRYSVFLAVFCSIPDYAGTAFLPLVIRNSQ
ncbi:hypothetical protein PUN28_015517 [Cardiocondyla obscurior]|uniref:Uncharacterized protein n=1 Tax=Cardiocondyla obscurior TaxID=286306 RepID=A0AAW2EVQ4_9HYME